MTNMPFDPEHPMVKTLMAHVTAEAQRDVDAVVATFGARAEFHDTPWSEHHVGHEQVCGYYTRAFTQFPDLTGELDSIHVAGDAITIQVTATGTHTSDWHGVKATGKQVQFPLCAVFLFDETSQLISETVYYDRLVVLQQLGASLP